MSLDATAAPIVVGDASRSGSRSGHVLLLQHGNNTPHDGERGESHKQKIENIYRLHPIATVGFHNRSLVWCRKLFGRVEQFLIGRLSTGAVLTKSSLQQQQPTSMGAKSPTGARSRWARGRRHRCRRRRRRR